MLLPISIISSVAVGCIIWRVWTNKAMRKRLSRALFNLGYLLYANTRCGKWLNERSIRKARLKFGAEGHSKTITFSYGSLRVTPIPFGYDNYAYVVRDSSTGDAVVIDAGDGAAVYQFLDSHGLVPKAVLSTHRHWDHCGGNGFLAKQYTNLLIYGSATDPPDGVNKYLAHEQEINVGSLNLIAYSTPGHTRGHMVYLLKGNEYGAESDFLFTGDLLFLAGCGKLFEGTAEEMLNSLDYVCGLPDSTLIWPGHEYAVDNLLFWLTIDGSREAVLDKLTWARRQRRELLPACPSTLKEEKEYNLFLRAGDGDLLKTLDIRRGEETSSGKSVSDSTPLASERQRVEVFRRLRKRKDETQ